MGVIGAESAEGEEEGGEGEGVAGDVAGDDGFEEVGCAVGLAVLEGAVDDGGEGGGEGAAVGGRGGVIKGLGDVGEGLAPAEVAGGGAPGGFPVVVGVVVDGEVAEDGEGVGDAGDAFVSGGHFLPNGEAFGGDEGSGLAGAVLGRALGAELDEGSAGGHEGSEGEDAAAEGFVLVAVLAMDFAEVVGAEEDAVAVMVA